MWEYQIRTAALYIEVSAQVTQRHRRTLDMPTGPAAAQIGVPRRLSGALGLPYQTVERMFLSLAVGVSPALGKESIHRRFVVARHRAECGIGVHVEIEIVVDSVDSSRGVEFLHEFDDEIDRLDGADVMIGGNDVERSHVGAKQLGLVFGEFDPVDPGLVCPFEQRVVDIGDVLCVYDRQSTVTPLALQQIEAEIGGRMPEMGRVVGGDSTDIQACGACGVRFAQHRGGAVVDTHRISRAEPQERQ